MKPAAAPAAQEEAPIVRRSRHGTAEVLEHFRVEVEVKDPENHGLIVLVDAPENLEKRLREHFKEGRPKKRVPAPGGGEATLYLLWPGKKGGIGPNDIARFSIDREHRLVRVSFMSMITSKHLAQQTGEITVGVGVRLGALEKGSWMVEVATNELGAMPETTPFPFLAGPGGPEPKGVPVPVDRKREAELPAFLITWSGVDPEHPLTAFVCKEEEFEAARAARLGEDGGREPAPIKPGDELVLYVLWGRRVGWPDASAEIDAKASLVRVDARWKGPAGMKTVQSSPYAGYGFKLGKLTAGKYSVEVGEIFPTAPEARRVTKKISFEVKARP